MSAPVNLKEFTPAQMEAWFESIGEQRFRARQVVQWLYLRGVEDFAAMTDLSKALRERLAALAELPRLQVLQVQRSAAGDTEKFLFGLPDGNAVESVLMHFDELKRERSGAGQSREAGDEARVRSAPPPLPEHLGASRATLCISTQVGCAMGCVFCASGQAGVLRNLKTWEITDQVLQVRKHVAPRGERVANVVYMGIGEPLANYGSTVRSLHILNHAEGMQIGMRHIAISTSGLVPGIRRLAQERLPLRLAISLHAPEDELRTRLVPINRVYPLGPLLDACRSYQAETGRRITFEYCLIRNVNDAPALAHGVGKILTGIHSLVNVIPLNPVAGYDGQRPTRERTVEFARIIEGYGIKTTVRQEMGTDIAAACGQLRQQASTWLPPDPAGRWRPGAA